MSCNTALPLITIASEVAEILAANYIDKDDPRIINGVFNEPTIRGGITFDESAKENMCEIVQACGLVAPFGKQWINRPLYPDQYLVSRDIEGDIEARWEAKPVTGADGGVRPTEGVAVGHLHIDKSLTAAGKPIWWTGAEWVDASGETV